MGFFSWLFSRDRVGTALKRHSAGRFFPLPASAAPNSTWPTWISRRVWCR
jgi:hypothetical protein